jgi:hypothetical protein
MRFSAPHWLTTIFGTVAIVCGALAQQNTFPSLTPLFMGVAGLGVIFALPTVTNTPKPPVAP